VGIYKYQLARIMRKDKQKLEQGQWFICHSLSKNFLFNLKTNPSKMEGFVFKLKRKYLERE